MSGDLQIIIENQEEIITKIAIIENVERIIIVVAIILTIQLIYGFLKDWWK